MNNHHQKVALITGGAQRLGSETARELHRRDWRVLIHFRHSRTAAEMLCAELNAARADSCKILCADLSRDDSVEKLAADACAAFNRVDALINNASAFYATPVSAGAPSRVTPAQWDDLFSSNARAPFFLAQALALELRKNQGAIINMLDIHAEHPLAAHTVYCMAKAANRMLTLSLAQELAPQVRVNGIAPGAILWPEKQALSDESKADILAGIPLQRLGTPQDIARTIAFLIEDAPYITGQILAVDGGRSV